VGPLAVSRRSLRSGGSIDTPPRDARSGPARSGAIGLGPLGGLGPPPPGGGVAGCIRLRQAPRLAAGLPTGGWGPSIRPSG